MPTPSKYAQARRAAQVPTQRLVVNLEKDQIDRIDLWGVSNRKLSRSEAVRDLIDQGLKSASGTDCPAPADFDKSAENIFQSE